MHKFSKYSGLKPPEALKEEVQKDAFTTNFFEDNMIADYEAPTSSDDYNLLNPFIEYTSFEDYLEPEETSDTILNIVELARTFVGLPYVWGGKSPKEGFDCSGLLSYVFTQNGIDLGRSTYEIFKSGKEVSLSEIQVGDIICTPGTGASGRHVKMVSLIDDKGIKVIEAKGKSKGIVEDYLTKTDNIITIRRLVDGDIYHFANNSSVPVSTEMTRLIKIMESGSENPKSKSAKVGTQYGETFATGLFGLTREFDKPGMPAIKNGQTFSLERWNSILNAFEQQAADKWKVALRGKSGVTLDKIDALVSISMSGNWATPSGWFGKFVIQNWDNPQAIYDTWLKSGITAAGNGKVLKGLINRRKFEANWFIGNKQPFSSYS